MQRSASVNQGGHAETPAKENDSTGAIHVREPSRGPRLSEGKSESWSRSINACTGEGESKRPQGHERFGEVDN